MFTAVPASFDIFSIYVATEILILNNTHLFGTENLSRWYQMLQNIHQFMLPLRNPFSKKHISPALRILQGGIRRSSISKSVCSRREREIQITVSRWIWCFFTAMSASLAYRVTLSASERGDSASQERSQAAMPCHSIPALSSMKPQLMLKSVGCIPFMVVSATLLVCQKYAHASEIPKDSRA